SPTTIIIASAYTPSSGLVSTIRLPSNATCTPRSFNVFDGDKSASKNSFNKADAACCRARRSASSLLRLASSSATALSSADIEPSRPTPPSADRAFKADRNQFLRLDREFHRQLLQHVLDEAVDHQRHRLLGREPALAAVEQHVFGDFRRRRLVLEHGRRIL